MRDPIELNSFEVGCPPRCAHVGVRQLLQAGINAPFLAGSQPTIARP
jgi:hypothetical protein